MSDRHVLIPIATMTSSQTAQAVTPKKTVKVLMFHVTPEAADLWFRLSNLALVIGAFAVAIGTYGAIQMGAAKERFADDRIAHNEALTASANAALGEAQKATAKLQRDTEGLKKQNLELSIQLEREHSDRLKLESHVRPRELSSDQRAKLVAALSALSPRPNIQLTLLADQEAGKYGRDIGEALEKAKVRGKADGVGMMVPPPYGVIVTLKPNDKLADGLRHAFEAAGIPATYSNGDTGEFDAHVLVGLRPLGPAP